STPSPWRWACAPGQTPEYWEGPRLPKNGHVPGRGWWLPTPAPMAPARARPGPHSPRATPPRQQPSRPRGTAQPDPWIPRPRPAALVGNWWQAGARPSTQPRSQAHGRAPVSPLDRGGTSAGCGGWIDGLLDFGDLGGGKATDFRMLANNRLVRGEVDAEGFVVGNVAFEPLDAGGKLVQHLVGLGRSTAQLLP